MMKVKRLSENATLPQKAHSGDLGYDLFSVEDVIIFRDETKLISTGIAIEFPVGYGGLIKDRSSVATKKNLFTVAGVIDNGYTGEIRIALFNASDGATKISAGEKIAQLVLIPTVDFEITEVFELSSTDGRGLQGFGSTGI
jgi:dUTP pyrophosphatase